MLLHVLTRQPGSFSWPEPTARSKIALAPNARLAAPFIRLPGRILPLPTSFSRDFSGQKWTDGKSPGGQNGWGHTSDANFEFTRKLWRAKKFRAVSSVVERLVYTERVGGSKPSPPSLHFRFSVCDLRFATPKFFACSRLTSELNSSRQHLSDGGFDMDFCCVEKWDAVVDRIAKN